MAFISEQYFIHLINSNAGATTILVFVFVFLVVYLAVRKPQSIPPGPSLTLPLLGDLPLLVLAGGNALKTFRKLRMKHGDIFSFYMGKELMVVINGYRLIYKAAVQKGPVFSSRPKNYMSNIGYGQQKGIIFSSGTLWKKQRRFVNLQLQNLGFGKSSFEDKIKIEVKAYIDALTETDGTPCDIAALTQVSVANVVFAIVCGKRHEFGDPRFQNLLKNANEAAKQLIKLSVVTNCFPFLRYLPGDPLYLKGYDKNTEFYIEFFTDLYNELIETFNHENLRDVIDAYICEMMKAEDSKENSDDFTFEQLGKVVGDLFGAGAETTATTIYWAVLILLNYPDIQARLHKDIDNVIEKEHLPCLDDKAALPYVEAFIMETLRYANVAPLAVPHSTTEDDVTFEGYIIPKDTSVIFNLDSVFFDPDVFEDPERFNPDRFMDKSGNILRPKEFLPFGIGRRVCLGEAVARMELFLFLTSVLKEFDFLPADKDTIPTLSGVLGITYSPYPYKVRVVRRANTA